MKKFFTKKAGLILTALTGTMIALPRGTWAASSNPSMVNWYTSPVTSAVLFISTAINSFLFLLVDLSAQIINLGIHLDESAFNSATVQQGFSIALAIANLGFVLGIIIIAIATILRSESYGIKQSLWKLVLMAILVNFGLVITGPIVGLADNLSNYFVGAMGGDNNVATLMATDFGVSKFQAPPDIVPAQTAGNTQQASNDCDLDPETALVCNAAANMTKGNDSSGATTFMQAVTAGFFSTIFLGIVVFTLLIVGIMLVVRYVYLVFLLIVLPLAWLTWIFPKFDYFAKWWGLFIKWALFPALVTFFLYVAMLSAVALNGSPTVPAANIDAAAVQNPNNPYAASAASTAHGGWTQQALNDIVLVGLALGGLFAAQALSLGGSEAVVSGAKWAGGQVKGFAAKQTKKAAVRIGKPAADKLSKGLKSNQTLAKIPLIGTVANKAGRAMEPYITNSKMVEEAKKHVSDNPESIKEALKGRMSMEETLAHISKLREKGKLAPDTMVRNQTVGAWMDANRPAIERYGWKHDQEEADKAIGNNAEMRAAMQPVIEAEAKVSNAKKSGNAQAIEAAIREFENVRTKAQPKIDEESGKFVDKLLKSDIAKANVNDVFGKDDFKTRSLLKNMALRQPHLPASAISKLKGAQLQTFNRVYDDVIQTEMSQRAFFVKSAEKAQAIKEQENQIERLTKQIAQTESEADKKAIQTQIDAGKAQIEILKKEQDALRQTMTREEENLETARRARKQAFDYNAVLQDPGTGTTSAPPASAVEGGAHS
ncbi:MAG TPA: hypothetical protein VMT99_02775 [Candidatus Paceibacterota bacterium]|nr:hypothetical protein [Candidatus Paceibacterota bacterium]